MKVYMVGGYNEPIEVKEATRVTEKSVFFPPDGIRSTKERREARDSMSYRYFLSWDEAYAYVLKKTERAVEYHNIMLEGAEARLEKIRGLVEPKEVDR